MTSDIKITKKSYQKFDGFKSSKLVLEFEGKLVSPSFVNSIRRATIDYVPIYGFAPESINIEKNTSLFNNDYMRLRISQFIIPNIDVPVVFLPDKYWKNINLSDPNREKHPDDKKKLEMYVNAENKTDTVMNVTTKHAQFFEDGKEIMPFSDKYPHLIIQLRPKEVFACRAVGVLNVGRNNNIWAAAGNAYHEYEFENPNKILLTIESQGQIDEFEILRRTCIILKEKVGYVKEYIQKNYNNKTIETGAIKLELENEDYTLGNLINEAFQNNPNIKYSGCAVPDYAADRVVIKLNDEKKSIMTSLDNVIDILDNVEKQIKKLV